MCYVATSKMAYPQSSVAPLMVLYSSNRFGRSNVTPHLHIRARASPRHLHEHSSTSVSVRMNCFHMRMNIHLFVHVNANEPFSSFIPFDSCWKTASRARATNGEANMWLVNSSFASLFASSLVQMCKYGITLLHVVSVA